jgi:hypothetical protein
LVGGEDVEGQVVCVEVPRRQPCPCHHHHAVGVVIAGGVERSRIIMAVAVMMLTLLRLGAAMDSSMKLSVVPASLNELSTPSFVAVAVVVVVELSSHYP